MYVRYFSEHIEILELQSAIEERKSLKDKREKTRSKSSYQLVPIDKDAVKNIKKSASEKRD